MKKWILFLLVAGLFTACQECPPDRYTTTSPDIDNTKGLIADYLAGNWDGWSTRYAADARIYTNSTVAATSGEVKTALQGILANFSEYKFDEDFMFYDRIVDDKGEIWVYFWSNWSGKFKANGNTLVVPVHLAQKYVDGKIAEEYGYYDLSKFAAELAAIAAAAAPAEEETAPAE